MGVGDAAAAVPFEGDVVVAGDRESAALVGDVLLELSRLSRDRMWLWV